MWRSATFVLILDAWSAVTSGIAGDISPARGIDRPDAAVLPGSLASVGSQDAIVRTRHEGYAQCDRQAHSPLLRPCLTGQSFSLESPNRKLQLGYVSRSWPFTRQSGLSSPTEAVPGGVYAGRAPPAPQNIIGCVTALKTALSHVTARCYTNRRRSSARSGAG
jgi:hypothetical protein